MTELILKKDIDDTKMNALLAFLKSWGIEVELKKSHSSSIGKSAEFSLSSGLWSDYNVDGNELRNNSWKRNGIN